VRPKTRLAAGPRWHSRDHDDKQVLSGLLLPRASGSGRLQPLTWTGFSCEMPPNATHRQSPLLSSAAAPYLRKGPTKGLVARHDLGAVARMVSSCISLGGAGIWLVAGRCRGRGREKTEEVRLDYTDVFDGQVHGLDKHGSGGQTSRQDPQVRVLASSSKTCLLLLRASVQQAGSSVPVRPPSAARILSPAPASSDQSSVQRAGS
jgi:hypothetical protein